MRRTFLALILALLTVAAPVMLAVPPPPRLLVLISVDQFRADFVGRYGVHWKAGLRRLFDSGAHFTEAAYPYMNTVTCAGHATMATGAYPSTHGLALNGWWDREAGRMMLCTEDPQARNIAHGAVPAAGGDSLWRMRVPTFADELRLQSPTPPRIASISLKARSAITLAGRRADLVTWHDYERGFVTSSAYAAGPVPFLQKHLAANPVEADAGRIWEKSLPAAAYAFADDGLGEQTPKTWSRTFPHPLPGRSEKPDPLFHELWDLTPFADAYLGRMAAAAVESLGMGRGPGTDFLAVSFSTLDLVGHSYGPASHEVQDVLARLDVTIGRLLDDLDRLVGRDQYVVALTADHGVSPIPEQAAAQGLDAGRIDGRALTARVEAAVAPWLGAGPHVDALVYTDLYFKRGVYEALLSQPAAMAAALAAIESTPGIQRAFRSDDLAAGRAGTDSMTRSVRNSYAPGRSGDILIVPRPYYLNSTAGATHGTGYAYDTRVPVVLAGPGIRAGEITSAASPADIVPTFAYLAGITMAATDGRVLDEALAAPAPAAAPRTSADAGTGGRPPDATR
jgi:predicted AlkP superfamily pyrophosphatase or phosphodiesterase